MHRSIRILLIAGACLALPATADAATPFTAGSGVAPSVAVGSDGTGHVVWQTEGDNNQVGYCRVSPGATSCNRTELLKFGAFTAVQRGGSKATVFTPAPNKVVIVAGCWQCGGGTADWTYRWISTNNGATFEGIGIGSGPETNGFGTWIEDTGVFVGANGSRVKAALNDLSKGVQYASGFLFVYGPQVVRLAGTTKLVAATNDLDTVKYGVYTGANLLIASINNASNWLIDRTLPAPETDNSDTALNSGPNGVFLTYMNFVANDNHVGLRRFDSSTNTFGVPVYVEGPDPIDNSSLRDPDSFQDPAGRIHVVWSTLYGGGRLRYTVSDPGVAAFTPSATLATSEGFHEPEIAAGADGKGFVTWTSGTTGPIRVVPIDPQAEPPPPPLDPVPGPPTISGFEIGDKTLKPGQRTKITFRASEAGMAVLTFEKRFKGLKGKRKGRRVCLAATKKRLRALRRKAKNARAYRRLLKKRSCRAFRRIGQIRQRVNPGKNTIFLNGRVAGRKLKPGSYRAKLVITDTVGLVSRIETLRFKVIAPKKKRKRTRR